MRHDGAAARIGDADAQLAFLIFGDVAEFALHGLARLADGFGIAQKRPACVGELKRRAAHNVAIAPSSTRSERSTSTVKSTCPGVSIRLIWYWLPM